MKTRDEQIEDAANERYPKIHPAWAGTENEAFINGAEWADQNKDQNFISSFERELSEQISRLEKEVERLSAPLVMPDEEIEKAWDDLSYYDSISSFERGVRWALEYLNAQRKDGG